MKDTDVVGISVKLRDEFFITTAEQLREKSGKTIEVPADGFQAMVEAMIKSCEVMSKVANDYAIQGQKEKMTIVSSIALLNTIALKLANVVESIDTTDESHLFDDAGNRIDKSKMN